MSAGRVDQACTSNADCEPTELCATGICSGGLGSCVERPTECEEPSPNDIVCGCDGQTYESECMASMVGVRLAQLGACVCDDNSECIESQFCALDDSCLNTGSCLPTPESCDPADTQEVCGCDGVTYANECAAFQARSRVSAIGACNCDTNDDCEASQFCNAITCDGPGVCEARASTCAPGDPEVIGCDGVTYENQCAAAMQGVRVRPDS